MKQEIIVAPATLSGGALAIIRLSGKGSIELVDKFFKARSKQQLSDSKGYTLHYGEIIDANDTIIDDVIISLFRAPHSYTGEDGVEISCHGSSYIVEQIIALSIAEGARLAEAGEFTSRAFLAGRMDLSQAEAVADVIASTSRASHRLATNQMRGDYSAKLSQLRSELIRLGALLELELDFSEEDVEFADRSKLSNAMELLMAEITKLIDSFSLGNAIKRGVSIAIVGAPNVGKSTLLNRLLGEDRAMVSDIAGTTRDSIEETISIDGIVYRFIDTAGIHSTDDKLERLGIERTHAAISRAEIMIHMFDDLNYPTSELIQLKPNQHLIYVANKLDLRTSTTEADKEAPTNQTIQTNISNPQSQTSLTGNSASHVASLVEISAKEGIGIDNLLAAISSQIDTQKLYAGDPIVSNVRHQSALQSAHASLQAAQSALRSNYPTDLVATDLRHTLHHIGTITGEITPDNLLHTIFSSFCIGK